MIDTVLRFTLETEVQRVHAQVLQEGSEVGSGTQRLEIQGGARVAVRARLVAVDALLRNGSRQNAGAGFGIFHVARRLAREALKGVTAAHAEIAAGNRVRIYVEDRFGLEFGRVQLRPFRGAQETRLLAVPARINQGAARPPPLLVQFA